MPCGRIGCDGYALAFAICWQGDIGSLDPECGIGCSLGNRDGNALAVIGNCRVDIKHTNARIGYGVIRVADIHICISNARQG